MGNFDRALIFILENEGAYSNDASDRGGETFCGISRFGREAHRCPAHASAISADAFRGPDGRTLAAHIYRLDYWRFDGIRDWRLAAKLLDIVVNMGAGMRVIQRAAMVPVDGKYGPKTEAALQRIPTEEMIGRLCSVMADHYVDICVGDFSQMKFLKGWMRRAVRRPAMT